MVGLGALLVPCALAILWKNEKRKVILANLTEKGQKVCHTVDANKPKSELESKLVHVAGVAQNNVNL